MAPRSLVPAVMLALAAAPTGARAQQNGGAPTDPERLPRPEARVVRAGSRIQADGRLDEPAGREAVPITDFIQAQPSSGEPATERTVVRLLYDDTRLYLGAVCYASDPHALVIETA